MSRNPLLQGEPKMDGRQENWDFIVLESSGMMMNHGFIDEFHEVSYRK